MVFQANFQVDGMHLIVKKIIAPKLNDYIFDEEENKIPSDSSNKEQSTPDSQKFELGFSKNDKVENSGDEFTMEQYYEIVQDINYKDMTPYMKGDRFFKNTSETKNMYNEIEKGEQESKKSGTQ